MYKFRASNSKQIHFEKSETIEGKKLKDVMTEYYLGLIILMMLINCTKRKFVVSCYEEYRTTYLMVE